MDVAVAQRLGVALAIGFVIGAERGWETRAAAEGGRTAGLRTFALTGLFGGLAALLAERFGASLLAVGFLGVAALAVASYFALVRAHGDLGFTTELALVLTYGLGALAGSGVQLEALAAAVVVAAILGFKRELHRGLEWLERREVTATLQLLLIAAVALPLLPDRAMGPFEALNPRRIGLLVLLLAAISYGGWFAVRLAGERAGLLLTASIIFHIFHSIFAMDFWSIWVGPKDIPEIKAEFLREIGKEPPGPKPGKYPLGNRLYHLVVMIAGLIVVASGIVMMYRVRTPVFDRNPYLFSDQTWGVTYVLHGLSGVGFVGLVIAHIYFALRPEKLWITRSMLLGYVTRREYLTHHDPDRWKAPVSRSAAGADVV